jgi:hypothetical protein
MGELHHHLQWIKLEYLLTMAYYPPKSRTFHLRGDASSISGYFRMVMLPQTTGTEATLTGASNSNNAVLIKAFSSDAVGVTSIPAGVWTFSLKALVDSAADLTYIKAYAFSRNLAGTETALFNATSAEINNTSVGAVTFSSTAQAAFTVAVTDRIVIKLYALSTSGTDKTVTLYYQGAANYSIVLIPDDIPVREGDMTKAVYDTDGDGVLVADAADLGSGSATNTYVLTADGAGGAAWAAAAGGDVATATIWDAKGD